MALDLGELVAYLDLDTTKFEKGANEAPGKISPAAFGAAGAIAGAAVAAALTKGAFDAINMQDTNAKVAAQLGFTATESARVGSLAGKVYAQNYGESVEQVQGTVGEIIKQIKGMGTASDSTVEGMTAKVLNYASAFEVETSEAVAMVQQLMSNGLATSADEAMDLMTTAMQKVPAALRGDMRDAITEYGPFLSELGMSGQEAFDLLARGSEQGMYGIDKAGDALKEFTIRATDMSKTSTDAYKSLGLDAEEMSNKILAGGDTAKGAFDTIVKGLLDIEDPAERSNTAIALFGTPLEDIGVNKIPAFLESLSGLGSGFEDSKGSAEAMGETMGSTVASQFESLKRTIEIMVAGLAEGLLPVLSAFFNFLAENPETLQIFGAAIGAMAAAWGVYTAAQWLANTAMFASPLTWIVLGIGAIVAALIWLVLNWDEVTAWITEVWDGFIGWITGVIDGFVGWWDDTWSGVGEWIQGVWDGFVGWIRDMWNGFVTWVVTTVVNLQARWDAIWTAVGKFIGDVWNGFVNYVRGILLGFSTWIISTVVGIQNTWNSIWTAVGNFFRGLWQGVVDWAMSVIGGFIGAFRGLWQGLGSFLNGLWSGITSTIRNAWNGVMDFLGSIPGRIKGFFSGIGTWLLDSGRALIQGFIDGISAMIGKVGEVVGGVMDFVGGFFPNSPAKRGQFSGSGWTRLRGSGAAVMDEWTAGLHSVDPFASEFEARVAESVRTGSLALEADLIANAGSGAERSGVAAVASTSKTLVYYAAEDRSLSSEESLMRALGSPDSPFGDD